MLPTDVDARRQILQEAEFYQLESLRVFLMHEDCKELQTAQDLRACIATRLEVLLFWNCSVTTSHAAGACCKRLRTVPGRCVLYPGDSCVIAIH